MAPLLWRHFSAATAEVLIVRYGKSFPWRLRAWLSPPLRLPVAVAGCDVDGSTSQFSQTKLTLRTGSPESRTSCTTLDGRGTSCQPTDRTRMDAVAIGRGSRPPAANCAGSLALFSWIMEMVAVRRWCRTRCLFGLWALRRTNMAAASTRKLWWRLWLVLFGRSVNSRVPLSVAMETVQQSHQLKSVNLG